MVVVCVPLALTIRSLATRHCNEVAPAVAERNCDCDDGEEDFLAAEVVVVGDTVELLVVLFIGD